MGKKIALVTGAALLAVGVATPAATASAPLGNLRNCAGGTCIEVDPIEGSVGELSNAWAWRETRFTGHFQVTGPNLNQDSEHRDWNAGQATGTFTARGRGEICAQAWAPGGLPLGSKVCVYRK